MIKLVAGLVLWWGGHQWKRLLPGLHRSMGLAAKGVSAIVILAGLVLMVAGYRASPFAQLWEPPAWGRHANNLLMLLAMIAVGLAHSKGAFAARIRHPLLTAALLWSLAHLLVRGDLAALILFGGVGLWALVERLSLAGEGIAAKGGTKRDLVGILAGVVLYGIVGYVHGMIGPSPFPG